MKVKGSDIELFFVYSDNIYAYHGLSNTIYSFDGTKMES
jgi:hypothetical protein